MPDTDMRQPVFDGFTEVASNLPMAKLQRNFIVPPFSVLDSRQGYWQDRKAA